MGKIDDLLKDPKFRQLMVQSPERAKSFVLEMKQKDFGIIPKTENLLQRAIGQARSAGTPFGMFTPKTGEEGLDIARTGLRQITNFSPGLVGQAAQAVDPRPGLEQVTPPQTDYGKTLEGAVNAGQLAFPALEVGPKMLGGLGKGIKGFFTGQPARGELEDLVRSGGKIAKEETGKFFKEKNLRFGEELEKVSSKMAHENYASMLERSAEQIGDSGAIGSSADKLLEAAKSIRNLGLSRSGGSSKVLTPKQIQFQQRGIMRLLGGDSRAKAIVHGNFLEEASQTAPKLVSLRESHAPVYGIAKRATALGKMGNLRRFSSGKMGPTEALEFEQTAKEIGGELPNFLERLVKASSKVKRGKKVRNAAIGLGSLGTVGGGLAYLKRLLTSQGKQQY